MPVECLPQANEKSLVGRVKQGFNLADGTAKSDKAFRDIRKITRLITGEYFDYTKPWKNKEWSLISRAIRDYVRNISELTPFFFNANLRLSERHLLARDLLMLLCQDEARNRARKPDTEKKKRGEEVKLGRRVTSQGICYLLSFSYV